jgi:hypothetical protein
MAVAMKASRKLAMLSISAFLLTAGSVLASV